MMDGRQRKGVEAEWWCLLSDRLWVNSTRSSHAVSNGADFEIAYRSEVDFICVLSAGPRDQLRLCI
jgi:hypothetical protein